jgi:hypothetical protein
MEEASLAQLANDHAVRNYRPDTAQKPFQYPKGEGDYDECNEEDEEGDEEGDEDEEEDESTDNESDKTTKQSSTTKKGQKSSRGSRSGGKKGKVTAVRKNKNSVDEGPSSSNAASTSPSGNQTQAASDKDGKNYCFHFLFYSPNFLYR